MVEQNLINRQTLLDLVDNPCFIVNQHLQVCAWNQAASNYFNYLEDNITDCNFFDLNLDPKLPFSKTELLEALTKSSKKDTLCFEDGFTRCELHVITDNTATHSQIIIKVKPYLLCEDQEKLNLLQNIIDNLPEYVYWKNTELEYQGGNARMIAELGFDNLNDFIGKTDSCFGWGNERIEILKKIDKEVILSKKSHTSTEEVTFSSGKIKTLKTSKIPLENCKNQVIGILGISTDISNEQKNNDNQQALINRLIDNLPEYVYWKNTNLEYQGGNLLVAQMLGLKTSKDMIGKTDLDFNWSIERIQELNSIDNQIISSGEMHTNTEDVLFPGVQQTQTLKTSKIPLKNDKGDIIGILGISTDITEQKNIERKLAEAKNLTEQTACAKAEFVANVSHDIQTPMHGIASIMTMLTRMPYNEKQAPFIKKLNQAIKRLSKLISEVLDFSKLEKNQFEIKLQSTNLRNVIEENFIFVEPLADKRGVRLELDCPDTVPRHFNSDPHLLGRILGNLLANAVKFTHDGFVKVKAECISETATMAQIKISVTDTGIGIPPDKLKFIFEPFARVGLSDSSRYKGTGLGLAITKKLVARLGGTIEVQSKLEQGSTFTCVFTFDKQTYKIQDKLTALD